MWASRFFARSPAAVGLLIRFLFIGSRFCSTLLSDPASRRRPCASLSLLLHQDVKRTFTSQLLNMLGTRKKAAGWPLPGNASPLFCAATGSVCRSVRFGGFLGMVFGVGMVGVGMVAVGRVRVMRSLLVVAGFMGRLPGRPSRRPMTRIPDRWRRAIAPYRPGPGPAGKACR